jgi:hypothetical protein
MSWRNITRKGGAYSICALLLIPGVLTTTRRTILDREPKVGSRHVDLLRLYKRVIAEGGYDKVSDTKGNKLAWRRLAGEFLPGSSNLTTQAFLVKTAYYKNLAYAAP